MDDAATQRPASHGAIARGWFNRALSSLLLCRSLSKTDQTSILMTKQRQAAVELFHGIDVGKNAMLSQEVSPLCFERQMPQEADIALYIDNLSISRFWLMSLLDTPPFTTTPLSLPYCAVIGQSQAGLLL